MNEEDVLQRIQELMEFNSWSTYRLAKEAGISYTSLTSAFKRKSRISVDTLQAICNAFHITFDQFFEMKENPLQSPDLSEEDQRLLNRYHSLSVQNQKILRAYMDGLFDSNKDG